MLERVEGIILRTQDYSETSKILNVLTKEHGIIGIISKGCRSLKSNLRSVSEPLVYGYFDIYYKSDKLSTLTNVDVINPFKNIKKSIEMISYASFILELTEQVYKQNSNTLLFSLLISGLIKIDSNFDPNVIMNIIELKYLEFLGVMPIIDSCSRCGKTTSIATLSSQAGGYICNECLNGEKIVSEKTIKLIRMYYYVDISKISRLEISDDVKIEINQFLDNYYDQYTGLYLKSKKFITNLERLK